MGFGKGTEFIPVRDFVSIARWDIRFGSQVPCFSLPLEPQVDRVAADIEDLASFALLHAILLNSLDDLLT